ncbi:ATP-dependent zinc protease family protein [Balneatrix alpica]|uniref:ATP-dependent zinc protease family protein n=1 Tax=Balneatrix alpica TaxID=75684 RepID=UPI0027383D5F|nr:ATP-dependent zinc protease [Balneatrix alpica]
MSDTAILGWYEWVQLPDLDLPPIKAKVDTGARTSCLHAFSIEPFVRDEQDWVRFHVHPLHKRDDEVRICEAPVLEQRHVRDSGGHVTLRYVIRTRMQLGSHIQDVDMTLMARDDMQFRMLIGRTSIPAGFLVNPHRSRLLSRKAPKRAVL